MLLGRYEVLSKIGTGGFGHVLLARAPYATPGGSHLVAIKRLRSSRAQRRGSEESFINEARIGQYLHHPNVVKVLEFARLGRDLILVMEYINGLGVDEMLGQGRLLNQLIPPDIAVEVTRQAAQGLHHAHTAVSTTGDPLEIIHRDVKPSNIMVCRQGIVRVMDFGVARWSQPRMHTTTGTIKGTLRYLAPEQASGSRDIGAACDQFALGLVLAEMIIGHAVYDAEHDHQVLLKALRVQVSPAIDEAEAAVPGMGAFLRRCLAVRPSDRFESMQEFNDALIQLHIPNPCNLTLSEWVHQGMLERARLTADDPDAYFRPGGDSGINPTGASDSDLSDDMGRPRRHGGGQEGHYYLATATAEHPPPPRNLLGSTNQTASLDSLRQGSDSSRMPSTAQLSSDQEDGPDPLPQEMSGWDSPANGFSSNPLADWDAFDEEGPFDTDGSDGSDGWRELEDVSDTAVASEQRDAAWAMVPDASTELDCDVLRQELISDEWLINLPAHELERRMRSKTDLSNEFDALPQDGKVERKPARSHSGSTGSGDVRKTSDIYARAMAEAFLQGQLNSGQEFLPQEPIPEAEEAPGPGTPALVPSDLPSETSYSMRRPGADRVEMRRRPVTLKFSPVANGPAGSESASPASVPAVDPIPMPGTTAELLGPAGRSFKPAAAPEPHTPNHTGSGKFDLESLGVPPFRSSYQDTSDTYDLQISDISDIFEIALSDEPEDELLAEHSDVVNREPPVRADTDLRADTAAEQGPSAPHGVSRSVEPMIHEVELSLPFMASSMASRAAPPVPTIEQGATAPAADQTLDPESPGQAPRGSGNAAAADEEALVTGKQAPEPMPRGAGGLELPQSPADHIDPSSLQSTGVLPRARRSGRHTTQAPREPSRVPAETGLTLPSAPLRETPADQLSQQITVEMDLGNSASGARGQRGAGGQTSSSPKSRAPVERESARAMTEVGLALPPRPAQEEVPPAAATELQTTRMSVEELQRRGMKDIMDWLARSRPTKG